MGKINQLVEQVFSLIKKRIVLQAKKFFNSTGFSVPDFAYQIFFYCSNIHKGQNIQLEKQYMSTILNSPLNLSHKKPASCVLIVDCRFCQINPERGIPTYIKNLIFALHMLKKEWKIFCVYRRDLALPSKEDILSQCGTALFDDEDINYSGSKIFYLQPFFFSWATPTYQELFPKFLIGKQAILLGVVHDLIPYLFPDHYLSNAIKKSLYYAQLRLIFYCHHLFTVSESTKNDVVKLLNINENKITAIYGGGNKQVSLFNDIHTLPGEVIKKSFLVPNQYLIYIGADEWRKNMDGLIRGFAIAKRNLVLKDIKLVVVCYLSKLTHRRLLKLLSSQGLALTDVVLTGRISDAELNCLLKYALASIFPSYYEGLGLPVLESYYAKTPVIGSNNSSLKEIIYSECLFPADNYYLMAEKIVEVVSSYELRNKSLLFGESIVQKYTWESAAQKMVCQLENFF